MAFCRILALMFTIAAVVFGCLQLFDHVEGASGPLTIQVLWERIDQASLDRILSGFGPDSPWLSSLQTFLALPAWVFCLALALFLWGVSALRRAE